MNNIIKEDIDIICHNDLDWGKFKDSSILITGAYGMLAQYMVNTLMSLNEYYPQLNINVVALGRDPEKLDNCFKEYSKNKLLTLLCRDVTDYSLTKYLGNVNYIIHAASPASSQFYGSNPTGVINANVIGTHNLLNLARENKVKGFLFLSSGEVSGKISKEIFTEEDYGPLNPTDLRSCYGESKRMAENMCKCYNKEFGIPTICVRPEHTYGPTMDIINDRRVFAEFVSNVVKGEDIIIKSDGKAVRTFCYIADATDGFFRALLNGKGGESYNIGNMGGRTSIGDLAEQLVSIFPEKKLKVIFQPRNDVNYLENKDNIRPTMSTVKIEALGYKPKYNVKDGFYMTVRSFVK